MRRDFNLYKCTFKYNIIGSECCIFFTVSDFIPRRLAFLAIFSGLIPKSIVIDGKEHTANVRVYKFKQLNKNTKLEILTIIKEHFKKEY